MGTGSSRSFESYPVKGGIKGELLPIIPLGSIRWHERRQGRFGLKHPSFPTQTRVDGGAEDVPGEVHQRVGQLRVDLHRRHARVVVVPQRAGVRRGGLPGG